MIARRLLLGAVLVLLVLILAVPLTPLGSRVLVQTLDALTPLEIEYGEGSLAGKLTVSRLGLMVDNTDIQLYGLTVDLRAACLLTSTVCLQDFTLERLDVGIGASLEEIEEQSQSQGESEGALFQFPVAVEAEAFTIQQTLIHWPSGHWSNGAIQGDVAIEGSRILLSRVTAEASYLSLGSKAGLDAPEQETIELPALSLPFELIAEQLLLQGPRWSFNDYEHQHDALSLSARWQHSTLEIEQASLNSEGWGALSLAGKLSFTGDWPLTVSGMLNIEQPPVLWHGLYQRSAQLDLGGSLGELDVSVNSPGEQVLQLQGQVNSLHPLVPFEIALDVQWSGPLALQDVPGVEGTVPEIQLTSPLQLIADGSLARQSFDLRGGATGLGYSDLSVYLKGRHQDFTVDIQALELRDPASDSALNLSGSLAISEAIGWDLQAQSSGLDFPVLGAQMPTGRIQGSFGSRGSYASDQWQLSLYDASLRGEVNGEPATLSGDMKLDSRLLIGESHLDLDAYGVALSLRAQEGSPPNIDLRLSELSNWLPDSRGALSLSVIAQDQQRRLVIQGHGQDVYWQGLELPSVSISGFYQLEGEGDFDLIAQAPGLAFKEWEWSELRISLQGSRAAQRLEISSRGDVETQINVRGGAWGESWSGLLQPASLVVGGGTWRLPKPVELQWDGGHKSLNIAAHCWSQNSSQICPGDLILGESGSADLKARLELGLLNALMPNNMTVQGAADAKIDVRWEPGAGLLGKGHLVFGSGALTRSYALDERATVNWERAAVDLLMDDAGLSVKAELQRDAKSGGLKFDLNLPAGAGQAIQGTLAVEDFRVKGALKPILPMLASHDGLVHGELKLSGTADAPLVHGQLALTEGTVSLVGNPTTVEDLTIRFDGKGERVDIAGAMLLGGGATELQGSLDLRPDLVLDLNISGEQQTILLPPGVEAKVSEQLRVVATVDHLDLSGNIQVHEGVLEHEQLPPGSVDVSTDVIEVDVAGEPIEKQSPFRYSTDIKVSIAESFEVEGTGLYTVVGGELELKKTLSEPLQLFGELNIAEGKFDAFGQNLKIRRGTLSFVGEPDNPDLNLRAEREIKDEGIVVGLEVLGNLEAFAFNLYSTPPLSESEMMSYLIRGRGLDKGAESDGAAVALSLGLGAVNQTGVMQGINKIPGISNVSFGTEGTAQDTAATLGGYIGDRIYISYGVGVYEPINVLTAKFFIFPRFWLEVVSSLISSADMYYSFDIE
ncbi:MAG: translocation/assembly module TamB domain-containing protein [Halioglobus sp.]